MKLLFFCPRWGSEQLSWKDFSQKVKEAGYEGVEYGIANETTAEELQSARSAAEQSGLWLIAQHYGTYDADFNRHYDTFAAWLDKVIPLKPYRINTQTGKDFFTFEQNRSLIDLADSFAGKAGIALSHETHRNKFSFAAHVTETYLEAIPSLRLTLDISHWVNVAESWLEDQPGAVELAITRTDHLHARVGYPEGPQVPDPRAPEWQEAVDKHLQWWDRLAEIKKREGHQAVFTITPEFGPYPYMVPMPYSRKPIASQWDINIFMMNLLRERYGK